MRWCEVSRMLRRDLCVCEGTLRVRTAKGGLARTVPVGLSLTTGLTELWRRAEPRGFARQRGLAFYTRTGSGLRHEAIARRMGWWSEAAFGQAFSFHCLRHTCAVRHYVATKDVVSVQRLLGHKSLHWTTAYLASLEVRAVSGLPSFVEGKANLCLFDPDGLGVERVVRAVASRKVRGKAAAGGDQEAFDWDDHAERRGGEVEEKDRRVCKAEKEEDGAFGKGGKWEGLTTAEAVELYEKEREAMTEEEAASEAALFEQEGQERVRANLGERVAADARRLRREAQGQEVKGDCLHGELREKRRANGRHELWCKECGAFVCYSNVPG